VNVILGLITSKSRWWWWRQQRDCEGRM